MNTEVTTLHTVLAQLFQDMLPLNAPLLGVSRALAGLLALFFLSGRVWGHLARAEPIDFFPLLRPFALGLAILFYPTLITAMNDLTTPVINVTQNMVDTQNAAVATMMQQQQSDTTQDLVDDIETQLNKVSTQNLIRQAVVTVLQWLFYAAALILDTLRTFILIVLSLLGPLALGLSVLRPFHNSFAQWLARYIHVSLWLPVANIYGAIIAKVQVLMLQQDTSGDFAHGQGMVYAIFLLMGIVGYACVPATAGYIVSASAGTEIVNKIKTLIK